MLSFLIAIVYICFITLGLPDSLLGSAWPSMYESFNVPLSYAGIISMIITFSTVISSLLSDYLTKKLSPQIVTVLSIFLTASALLGFSFASKFYHLILLAIPYGLGAGAIDAALNNYVALHFKSRHMSWLHCMWGLGAFISPYIMGYALTYKASWNKGYLLVSIIQFALFAFVLLTLPVWKKVKFDVNENDTSNEERKPLKLKEIMSIKGAIFCFIMFFCYCGFEATGFLWSSSYLNLHSLVSKELAANLACLFYGGMTIGRAINGFLTFKYDDKTLIRIGSTIILIGAVVLFIPNVIASYIGLTVIGLGCAPIYPCIIHMTPTLFGKDKSQAMIGFQMACAYTGSTLIPPLFGLIANNISISLFPIYIIFFLIIMVLCHELLQLKRKA